MTPFTKSIATRHLLQSSLLHCTIKSPSTIFGNILSKDQIPFWQNFTKTQNPSTILGNILSKAQILFWQNFTKTQILLKARKILQKLKYY